MRVTAEERFWPNVNKTDGCWLWTASVVKNRRNAQSYGQFSVKRRPVLAHRYSWELHNGPIPNEFFVLHSCRNSLCVRPEHLFLGTANDRIEMSHVARGTRHGRAKLKERDVLEIRRLHAMGHSNLRLAKEFGVNATTVGQIVRQLTWTHI